jgi:hypothetical protein
MRVSRRQTLIALGATAIFPQGALSAAGLPTISVTKDPNCSCCAGWVDHLKQAGFPVTVVTSTDLKPIKARLGVPDDLASCHTAQVGAYVIEGHVPASAIQRLLLETPTATGLAVPDMPAGSPGMDGTPVPFDVILFSPTERRSYGRYIADQPL